MKRSLSLFLALILTGCSFTATSATGSTISTSTASKTSTIATDIGLIAKGITPAVNVIESLLNTSPAVQTQVASILKNIQGISANIATAADQNSILSYAKAFIALLNSLLEIAATLPLPSPYSSIIQAAAALLPVIEADVGLVGAVYNPTTATTNIDPNLARIILNGAAIN